MGNMHTSYTFFKDEFQKRLEALALEVETGGTVAEDGAPWVLGLELVDLSLEVSELFSGRDACVDDVATGVSCVALV